MMFVTTVSVYKRFASGLKIQLIQGVGNNSTCLKISCLRDENIVIIKVYKQQY